MAPPTRTPPSRWIEEGLRALAAGGPEAVRVEALARALGVTKGGFYNHFEDRPALLGAMLDAWERTVVDEVIAHVESSGAGAGEKLLRLFGAGASRPGQLMKVELAIRDWARRDPSVARRLKRIDERRVAYLRTLFAGIVGDEEEVELRCLTAMALFVGVPSIAADLGRGRRRELHRLAFERLARP